MKYNRSTFSIPKMDCSSEENLIRLKLKGSEQIKSMVFDLKNRTLEIYHEDTSEPILAELEKLNLGAKHVSSELVETVEEDHVQDKKLLWIVLSINFFFFFLEILAGFLSRSMGLVADSLDMLADSLVYALALFAVGGTLILKKKISKIAGYFQLVLAILGIIEVSRRFFGFEQVPDFRTMIVISVLALIGNALCLYLLQKSRNREAHMQASIIFTSNDVIVNLGVIVAGTTVYFTNSKHPDLIVGAIVFLLVLRGAYRILKL